MNMKTGPISEREHTAFLMMWLEKFIFCGKSASPTSTTQSLAEALVRGAAVPLGKHLLGSVYYMLHQVAVKLSKGEPIKNPGGPWWFLNFWLNLYMTKISKERVELKTFPVVEEEADPSARRRCTSFGEAVSAFPGSQFIPSKWPNTLDVSIMVSMRRPWIGTHIKGKSQSMSTQYASTRPSTLLMMRF